MLSVSVTSVALLPSGLKTCESLTLTLQQLSEAHQKLSFLIKNER